MAHAPRRRLDRCNVPRRAGGREDAALVVAGRLPHGRSPRTERGPEQPHQRRDLRAPHRARQAASDHPVARDLVGTGEPHALAVPPEEGRRLPRRNSHDRRRCGVLDPAGTTSELEFQGVRDTDRQATPHRRLHDRDRHRRARPRFGLPRERELGAHHEPRLVREARRHEAAGLQERRGDLRLARCERHRPVRAREARRRSGDGAEEIPAVVGHRRGALRGQRGRDRVPAHQVRCDAHGGAAVGRDRPRAGSAAAGFATPFRQSRAACRRRAPRTA